MDPDGRKAFPVTDEQWKDINNELVKLDNNLSKLIAILKDANNDISSVDEKIIKSARQYLVSEFGNGLYDCSELSNRLTLIREEVKSLNRDDFKYDSKLGAYAKTMPFISKTIVLGDKYFGIDSNSTRDTKDGTLLHEVTHHASVLLTFDITYKDNKMRKLSDYGIFSKSYNANNWEYFYEAIF